MSRVMNVAAAYQPDPDLCAACWQPIHRLSILGCTCPERCSCGAWNCDRQHDPAANEEGE